MASIQARVSRGKKYWSIVESRRINGKPRTFILECLTITETLLQRLTNKSEGKIKSYTHGDTIALINIAKELNIIDAINCHIPTLTSGKKPVRDGLSVGGSFLLGALGRACHPTSKLGWFGWCKETSLQYTLRRSLKNIDSQHFWDQMDYLPPEKIPLIEEEIIKKLIKTYNIKLDTLLFDTTNFFTFIDSTNDHCDIPQRGKNKQKRFDLRQIGMALLVTRKEQLPLFHSSYRGNKNDITVFGEVFQNMAKRLQNIAEELTDITIVFDKGNNSKDNFKMIDETNNLHYVGGLVSSYFVDLIKEANKNFISITIAGEEIPAYRVKKEIWGQERTCVVSVSKQLKEGQIRGICQHADKKMLALEKFKQQLENPRGSKKLDVKDIKERIDKIIKGQFIDEILKYKIFETNNGLKSFRYFIDGKTFEELKENILGRRILVTNRHDWTSEEVIMAYRGQAKVEYAFRNLKNPYHLAIRPQYHWTDQKIKAHIFMCILSYLLTAAAYVKASADGGYKRNLNNFMEDLSTIRLTSCSKKKDNKISYQLEEIPLALKNTAKVLSISNDNLHPKLNFSDYI